MCHSSLYWHYSRNQNNHNKRNSKKIILNLTLFYIFNIILQVQSYFLLHNFCECWDVFHIAVSSLIHSQNFFILCYAQTWAMFVSVSSADFGIRMPLKGQSILNSFTVLLSQNIALQLCLNSWNQMGPKKMCYPLWTREWLMCCRLTDDWSKISPHFPKPLCSKCLKVRATWWYQYIYPVEEKELNCGHSMFCRSGNYYFIICRKTDEESTQASKQATLIIQAFYNYSNQVCIYKLDFHVNIIMVIFIKTNVIQF
jgi:hypothetical protein